VRRAFSAAASAAWAVRFTAGLAAAGRWGARAAAGGVAAARWKVRRKAVNVLAGVVSYVGLMLAELGRVAAAEAAVGRVSVLEGP